MNILVTGASGFIGKNLIAKIAKDHPQYGLFSIIRQNSQRDVFEGKKIEIFIDTGDTQALVSWFQLKQIDFVIHLASLYLKDHSSEQVSSLIESNIQFGARLLEASQKSGVKGFINTGTAFQHYHGENYCPVNLYAATKQAFEDLASFYIQAHGLYFATLKLNDTFGPGDTRKKIMNLWLELPESETLRMSPGEQKIDIMYIDDVVNAYLSLLELMKNNAGEKKYNGAVFSIHNEEITSLKELASKFQNVTGKSLKIQWGALPYRPREVMEPWTGGEKIPNWKQSYDIETGILKSTKQ